MEIGLPGFRECGQKDFGLTVINLCYSIYNNHTGTRGELEFWVFVLSREKREIHEPNLVRSKVSIVRFEKQERNVP
jgi:hypothetical protein